MQDNQTCDYVVRFLDATIRELNPSEEFPNIVKALGSYVKNHKVNPRNIFDIVETLWPDAEMSTAEGGDFSDYLTGPDDRNQDTLTIYNITFPDKSQGMIVAARGLSIDFLVM